MKCARCGNPIANPGDAWHQVCGFARPAKLRQGAGSSLIGRRKTGKAICGACAMQIQHGINRGQESLGV